jgi:hypothetical protein
MRGLGLPRADEEVERLEFWVEWHLRKRKGSPLCHGGHNSSLDESLAAHDTDGVSCGTVSALR